jgi:hypothetical protein
LAFHKGRRYSSRQPQNQAQAMSSNFRVEHDFLGEKQIPADAYWGVHTTRANP